MFMGRLDEIETFVAIADGGNLSEASRKSSWLGLPAWDFVRADGTSGRVRVTPRLQCSSSAALRSAAEQGLGILCVPTFLTAQAVAQGRLVSLRTIIADTRACVKGAA